MKTISTPEETTYYHAIHLLHSLYRRKWALVNDPRHVLCMSDPSGRKYTLLEALYFATTQQTFDGRNQYEAMKEAGFKLNLIEKLQYLAEHPDYVGTRSFIESIKGKALAA